MEPTQRNCPVAVIGPLKEDILLFNGMTGFDKLSTLSEYTVELLCKEKDLDFAKVLGKTMTVAMKYGTGGKKREFSGIVTQFSSFGVAEEYTRYVAVLKPALWLLTRTTDCQIYPDQTVVEIVKAVCGKPVYRGLCVVDEDWLEKSYPKLEYCVQYRESDFNFVCRLLEHAGIYFYFKYVDGMHMMVLADSYGAHLPAPDYSEIVFDDKHSRDVSGSERITSWSSSGEIESSGFALRDFDFTKMMGGTFGQLNAKESIPAAFFQPAYQQYDYPGGYATVEMGKDMADARIEELHGQSERILAAGNARGLVVGALFTLQKHPVDSMNREYLITAAQYRLAGNHYGEIGSTAIGRVFDCQFNAVGKKYPFRPERRIAKPVVSGPQTAVVVGKQGEEIWTDPYGRVKVQFHWDRLGERDGKNSCWLRVAQSWAGERWGSMFVPRIGMEVLVEFIDGDPDRPIITGCVYNSANMPPYALPEHQTRSTLKTNSSKGGGGFNELRFEDKKGAEEIFVQAEKDFNRVVKHHDSLKVGFLHKEPGNQTIAIRNNQKLDVGNDQIVRIAKHQKTKIEATQTVKVGQTLEIEAGTSILFKVGGSTIKLEAGQITINSPLVKIN